MKGFCSTHRPFFFIYDTQAQNFDYQSFLMISGGIMLETNTILETKFGDDP